MNNIGQDQEILCRLIDQRNRDIKAWRRLREEARNRNRVRRVVWSGHLVVANALVQGVLQEKTDVVSES